LAAGLFLSRKSVERQVSNILAKLGIGKRTELAGALAATLGGRSEARRSSLRGHVLVWSSPGCGTVRRTDAGEPATTVYGSTLSRTSEPTPTTACSPMEHGPTTMAKLANHAPSPMLTSRPVLGTAIWRSRPNVVKSWVPVRIATLWPKNACRPTVISPDDRLNSAFVDDRGRIAVEAGRVTRDERFTQRILDDGCQLFGYRLAHHWLQ
jgi:hypothetical protein